MLYFRNRSTFMPSRAAVAALALGIAATLGAAGSPADTAATAAPDATSESSSLDEVIVTGSRQKDIKATDSPAPIQIVSVQALKMAGASDLMGALAQLVPSLQMQAFGFDQAGQTLLAKLRGLSPNDVLVLINGKRRHTTANLQVDTGSPYQGGAGCRPQLHPARCHRSHRSADGRRRRTVRHGRDRGRHQHHLEEAIPPAAP